MEDKISVNIQELRKLVRESVKKKLNSFKKESVEPVVSSPGKFDAKSSTQRVKMEASKPIDPLAVEELYSWIKTDENLSKLKDKIEARLVELLNNDDDPYIPGTGSTLPWDRLVNIAAEKYKKDWGRHFSFTKDERKEVANMLRDEFDTKVDNDHFVEEPDDYGLHF